MSCVRSLVRDTTKTTRKNTTMNFGSATNESLGIRGSDEQPVQWALIGNDYGLADKRSFENTTGRPVLVMYPTGRIRVIEPKDPSDRKQPNGRVVYTQLEHDIPAEYAATLNRCGDTSNMPPRENIAIDASAFVTKYRCVPHNSSGIVEWNRAIVTIPTRALETGPIWIAQIGAVLAFEEYKDVMASRLPNNGSLIDNLITAISHRDRAGITYDLSGVCIVATVPRDSHVTSMYIDYGMGRLGYIQCIPDDSRPSTLYVLLGTSAGGGSSPPMMSIPIDNMESQIYRLRSDEDDSRYGLTVAIGTDSSKVISALADYESDYVKRKYDKLLADDMNEVRSECAKLVSKAKDELSLAKRELDKVKFDYTELKNAYDDMVSGAKTDHQITLSENSMKTSLAKARTDLEMQERKLENERAVQPYKVKAIEASNEAATLKILAASIPVGILLWKVIAPAAIVAGTTVVAAGAGAATGKALIAANKAVAKACRKIGKVTKKLLKSAYCMVKSIGRAIWGGLSRVWEAIRSWF